jgi:hypothetical protein
MPWVFLSAFNLLWYVVCQIVPCRWLVQINIDGRDLFSDKTELTKGRLGELFTEKRVGC